MTAARDMTTRPDDADFDLMQRVASNDEAAIADLYDRFGALVYRMAYQMMPKKADAEDAVQEIFVRLWRSAGRYDPERAALSTWVVLITRRHLVDRLRRARVRVKASVALEEDWAPESDTERPEVGIGEQERFAELMKRIDTLPELQRAVLIRAYLKGQTLRQIGMELNRPVGTIKSTLSRALVRLRERSAAEEQVA
ncbi:MAG: sigma-70 family RNA polymerase sigma factor [Planctomycetota bacterium]|nr:sigma-70 family RNA polymerase sigma factor [Planctomycetota bacterium]